MKSQRPSTKVRIMAEKSMAVLTLDSKIYPKDAVMGAAYVFIDRCYVRLDVPGPDRITVRLKTKEPWDRDGLAVLVGEFENELLHQAWRLSLEQGRSRMREYILAKALMTVEQDNEMKDQTYETSKPDYMEDPLGIAVPWEEKFAKNSGEGN